MKVHRSAGFSPNLIENLTSIQFFPQTPLTHSCQLPCRQSLSLIYIHICYVYIHNTRLSLEFLFFHFGQLDEMEATAYNLLLCGIHRFSSKLMEAQAGKSMFAVELPQSLKSSNSFRLRWGGSSKLELKSRSSIRIVASSSNSVYESSATSKIEEDDDGGLVCPPGYRPTPANREPRTPHSGYHFDGSTRKFFEGWYFKVSIPQKRQSFCFMYSVENPAFPKKLTPVEIAQHGPRFTGVGAQILGAYDKYICQYSEESQNFWGSRHELSLGNSFATKGGFKPPNKEVNPEEFNKKVVEGFQVTPLWHQGFIRDDGRTNYLETVKTARWEYSTRPVYGWGNVGSKQKSTAGWLAAFPVFEPHWQICMAGGLSTGWIEWEDERFEFVNAPSYSEKNWGGGFPRKWFWVQCNVFEGARGEVALTAGGGLRQLPGLTETFENAALVGVHYDGIFYEFVPWNGSVNWEISTWGYWYIAAENETHKIELEGKTDEPGSPLRAPTTECGLDTACKDTCFGILKLQMWERRFDGSKGKIVLDVTSNMAALEVGGGPWFNTWKGETRTPEILKRALTTPIDVDQAFKLLPLFKPPGL